MKKVIKRVGVVLCLAVCVVFAFALIGCEETNQNVPSKTNNNLQNAQSFQEVVNNIKWTVYYNSDIVSITANYTKRDDSEYYRFLKMYYGDSTTYANHVVSLVGYPIGDNWYKIEQTETYTTGWDVDESDWEKFKLTYPSCTFDEEKRSVTFFRRITRYEEKIEFSNFRVIIP